VISPFVIGNLDPSLDGGEANDHSDEVDVGAVGLMRYKRVFFAAVSHFFNLIIFTFADPILAPHLENEKGLSTWQIGLVFGLPIAAYIITGPLLLQRLTKHFVLRTVIHIGFFAQALALLLVGPSETLHFMDRLGITLFGMFCIGVGAAFTVIPIIPEMLDAVEGEF
jgi:hypothetical protein